MSLYEGSEKPVAGFCMSRSNGVCARNVPCFVLVTRPFPDVMQDVSVGHEMEINLSPVNPASPSIGTGLQWSPPSWVEMTAGSLAAAPAR
jgi:hypothetical protein